MDPEGIAYFVSSPEIQNQVMSVEIRENSRSPVFHNSSVEG